LALKVCAFLLRTALQVGEELNHLIYALEKISSQPPANLSLKTYTSLLRTACRLVKSSTT
jgi:hypothetical protein